MMKETTMLEDYLSWLKGEPPGGYDCDSTALIYQYDFSDVHRVMCSIIGDRMNDLEREITIQEATKYDINRG